MFNYSCNNVTEPDGIHILLDRAIHHIKKNELQKAMEYLDVLTLTFKHIHIINNNVQKRAFFYKGICLLKQKNFDNALKCFDQASSEYSSNIRILRFRAYDVDETNSMALIAPKSLFSCEPVSNVPYIEPRNKINILTQQALKYEASQRFDAAVKIWNNILILTPKNEDAVKKMIACCIAQNNFDKAYYCCRYLALLTPTYENRARFAEMCVRKGDDLRGVDVNDAVDEYRMAFEIDPDNVSALSSIIQCCFYEDAGNLSFQELLLYVETLLQWGLNNSFANVSMVYIRTILAMKGRRKDACIKAIAFCNKAITLNPENANLFFFKGYCYQNYKKYTAALENFQQASALSPNNLKILFYRAKCYRALGKYSKAIQDYSIIIKNAANNRTNTHYYFATYSELYFPAVLQISWCYHAKHQFIKCIESISKIIETATTRPNYLLGINALSKLENIRKVIIGKLKEQIFSGKKSSPHNFNNQCNRW